MSETEITADEVLARLAACDAEVDRLLNKLNYQPPDYDENVDVLKRLRELENWTFDGVKSSSIYKRAADEIEDQSKWAALAHEELSSIGVILGARFMDPPDGGDVSLAEQVQRLLDDHTRLLVENKVKDTMLLAAETMLSEMHLLPDEKCQMAYDFLNSLRGYHEQ